MLLSRLLALLMELKRSTLTLTPLNSMSLDWKVELVLAIKKKMKIVFMTKCEDHKFVVNSPL